MTGRHCGYIVALEGNIRDDEAEATLAAMRMIKGVIAVEPVEGDINTAIAKSQARFELGRQILEILYPKNVT